MHRGESRVQWPDPPWASVSKRKTRPPSTLLSSSTGGGGGAVTEGPWGLEQDNWIHPEGYEWEEVCPAMPQVQASWGGNTKGKGRVSSHGYGKSSWKKGGGKKDAEKGGERDKPGEGQEPILPLWRAQICCPKRVPVAKGRVGEVVQLHRHCGMIDSP